MNWSEEEYQAYINKESVKQKKNKYGVASKEDRTAEGITFASKAEKDRYLVLKDMEKCKEIKNLVLQPKFVLQEKFKKDGQTYNSIEYKADFAYFDVSSGIEIIEDVKGMKTQVYKLKKKLLLKKYPDINFREVS
ncbi:MAG: DUF1064 domain-containing protein [Candidatus Odinarchaeota archaeon]